MQYLPIYPEKSWSETVLPSDYRGSGREDGLPLTDSLITSMASLPSNYPETLYPRVMGAVSMPFIMLADGMGQIGNTAYNGYKRLYNYGANAYNNLADTYNNWVMQRTTPQTSLTGRKMPSTMVIPQAPATVGIPQPDAYLQGVNGEIVAKEIKPPVYTVPVGDNRQKARGMVTSELSRMRNSGELKTNLTKVHQLIDLYNKLR